MVADVSGRMARLRGPDVASRVGWITLIGVTAVIVLWPSLLILGRALGDGGASFQAMLDLPDIRSTIIRTLALGFGSATIALIFGLLLAWSINGLTGRLRTVAAVIPIFPLIMPAPVVVMGFAFLASPRVGYLNQFLRTLPMFDHLTQGPLDVYTTPWIILVTGIFLTSFTYLFIYARLQEIGPNLEAASAVSGASGTRTFMKVLLPLLRPSLVYSFGIALVLGSGQFTAPLILGRQRGIDVLTTEMFKLTERFPIDYGLGAALAAPLVVLGVAVVILQQRVIGDRRRFVVERNGGGGRGTARASGGTASRWRLAPVLVYAVSGLLPFLAIVHVALSPFWAGSFSVSNYTLSHVTGLLQDDRFYAALRTSLASTVVAIAVLIPLTFLIALALLPRSGLGRLSRWFLDLSANLPLGIPSAVFGFGVLFAYTRDPFSLYGTVAVVVIVYITIMLPFSMRLQQASLTTMARQYRDASETSGASAWRTVRRIIVPLARPGIVSAVVLTFVLLMQEFGASLMVRAPNREVLGALLYDYYHNGVFPETAVLGLFLVLLTGSGVALVFAVGGKSLRST